MDAREDVLVLGVNCSALCMMLYIYARLRDLARSNQTRVSFREMDGKKRTVADVMRLTLSELFPSEHNNTAKHLHPHFEGWVLRDLRRQQQQQQQLPTLVQTILSMTNETVVFVGDANPQHELVYAICVNHDTISVVFRGTDNAHNLFRALRCGFTTIKTVRVHTGVARYLLGRLLLHEILDRVQHTLLLYGRNKIVFTGHSLGASLATLCAWYAASRFGPHMVSVVTFAGPRVGDRAFCNAYHVSSHYAFCNVGDPVVHTPLFGHFCCSRYHHVEGTRISLKRTCSEWNMLRSHLLGEYHERLQQHIITNKKKKEEPIKKE